MTELGKVDAEVGFSANEMGGLHRSVLGAVENSASNLRTHLSTPSTGSFDDAKRSALFLEQAALIPRPPFKRARWADLNSDATMLAQQPAIGAEVPPPAAMDVSYSQALPQSFSQPYVMESSVGMPNGHASLGNYNPVSFFLHQSPSISLHLPSVLNSNQLRCGPPYSHVGAGCLNRNEVAIKELPFSEESMFQVLTELERTRRQNEELKGIILTLQERLRQEDRIHGNLAADNPSPGNLIENNQDNSKKSCKYLGVEYIDNGESSKMSGNSIHSNQCEQTKGIVDRGVSMNGRHSAVTWISREDTHVCPSELMRKDVSDKYESAPSYDSDDSDGEDDAVDEKGTRDVNANLHQAEDNPVSQVGIKQIEEQHKEAAHKAHEVAENLLVEGSNKGKAYEDNLHVNKEDQEGSAAMSFSGTYNKRRNQEVEEFEVDGQQKQRTRKKWKEGKKLKGAEKNHATKKNAGYEMIPCRGLGLWTTYKKAPKVAFCPKEVKRVLESGVLALKNAQSHTMRKIIVFASLGIRHGCEDLYELDFNHFSVIKCDEPYVSPDDPGEHVLYDNPGVRRKIFYPNRQNPILCPVRILEEERTMRPSATTCPSCFFLCIKYGGRTRNLPQNEYVRQRMGRNKLKSFGPLMCQMALLINIRTGSFFFKALGITLLYMAGFPDELVCKETKYQSLDLLQKYYRSDKDAKEEQLFHPYPPFSPQGMMAASNVSPKALPAVSKTTGKKRPLLLSKPPSLQAGYFLQTFPGVVPSLQFGPSSFPLTPPLHPPSNSEPPAVSLASSANPSSQVLTGSALTTTTAAAAAAVPLPSPTFGIYPSYPVQRAQGGYSPVPLWPSLNPFPLNAFATSAYAYSPLSKTSQYGSALHTSCFGHAYFASYPPQSTTEAKQEDDSENIESGSESSSSGSDPKSTQANSSES